MSNLEKTRQTLVRLAKEIALSYSVDFNLSEESIKGVDTILADIHEDLKRSPENIQKQQAAYGIALEMAAYIVEVIESHHGKGKWKKDDEQYGADTWPFLLGKITVFPVGWAVKCIENGRSDAVWKKYTDFLEAMKANKQEI